LTGDQLLNENTVIEPGHIIKYFGTNNLAKGVYFLRIMGDSAVVIKKIVIE
jgi:hypothetical protein